MGSQLAGLSAEEVYRYGDGGGDPMREAVFHYARRVARDPARVERSDVESLRRHLTDAQIVELTLAICRYGTMNRLADAFGVPLESENVFAPPPASPATAGESPATRGAGKAGASPPPARS